MNSFINYIIESGISLGGLSMVYFLFLRNETFFKANRFFLLFAIVFSSTLPLLHIPLFQQKLIAGSEEMAAAPTMLETVNVINSGISQTLTDLVTTNNLLVFAYLLMTFILTLRLLLRMIQLAFIINKNTVVKKAGIKLVYIKEDSSPYSFLNYLFVSRQLEKMPAWEKMLAHESEHIHQGHTVDVLVLELISLVQWFNPFFWMIKRVIKENHEYMADKAVLNKGVSVHLYKQVLIQQFVGKQLSIANNFNSTLIKSRLKMMTKIKSSKLSGLRFISAGIVTLLLLLVFACENKTDILTEDGTEQASEKQMLSALTKDSPLIIVNEEVYEGDINSISPDTIISITIQKKTDNNLIAKYGEKAKNGVIYIKTKSNKTIDAIPKSLSTEVSSSKEQVFFIVEEMPEFPGGEEALHQFIAKSVKYPVIAQENGIQGKVYVNFVVEKDGSIGHVKIARGVDPSIDKEALRIINSLPKWIPGKQKGEAVAVSYTVPINFILQ